MKKVLLLNLPNQEQITRKYMSSYTSPESLMPPLELISCGAVCREWHQAEVHLIDAIAEKLTLSETAQKIQQLMPTIIISIVGFECYQEDIDAVAYLKNHNLDITYILLGYYPTQFPSETLLHSQADFVILGEPELILNDLLKSLFDQQPLALVNGIAYKQNGIIKTQGISGRIKDPNELPVPAYDLLPSGKYYEPLFAHPYGMIQTVRGCPYQCNFCVKSYGSKLSQLSTERIIEEIKLWIDLHGVKSIRFIDDTFTINKRRVLELCQAIITNNIQIEWACLTRTDGIDLELLNWMKKAGCKRIYFGIESGSQRMLDIYKKNINVQEALASLKLCRKAGIETAAFFMTGHPKETEKDFEETVAFAKAANLSYASYNPLKPYPGTEMFKEVKDLLEFSIYPYRNRWKDLLVDKNYDRRKQLFYSAFYLRFSFFTTNFLVLLKNSHQILILGVKLLRYLWWDKQFIIGGRKSVLDK